MKTLKLLAAASVLAMSVGAQAAVSGSLLTTSSGPFLTLSSTGLDGVATLDMPADVYSATIPGEAAMPMGTVGNFLGAGGDAATFTFTTPVTSVSFDWGSPDVYNILTVGSTGSAPTTFTTSTLGFSVTDGDQSFSQYVLLTATDGSTITSLTFGNTPLMIAFEASNFQVTSPVPEPETYALLLAGLGAIGFITRRQQKR